MHIVRHSCLLLGWDEPDRADILDAFDNVS